jgi:hypothetical protein
MTGISRTAAVDFTDKNWPGGCREQLFHAESTGPHLEFAE